MDERSEGQERPEVESRPVDKPSEFPWSGVIGTIGLILVVVFAVQNTETVPVSFLRMSWEFPLTFVILASAVGAAVFTSIASRFLRRGRRRRLEERQARKRLREQERD